MSKVYAPKEKELEQISQRVKEIEPDSEIIYYYYLEDQYRMLAGRILTIIDAAINDKQQNKCVKDLVRAEFHRRIIELQGKYWEGKQGHSVRLEG